MKILSRAREARSREAHLYSSRLRRRKRFSPPMLIGMITTACIVLLGGAFLFMQPHTGSFAADPQVNTNCTLLVPAHPLSAQGLATPYQLTATNPHDGPCHEANVNQTAFVQGAVFDPATDHISIYNPLVVDKSRQPAIDPVVPTLPQGAIVGIWVGFNGGQLRLKGIDGSLQDGHCVDGLDRSIFGQVSYCNAVAFFQAANQAIAAGKLVPPALGTAKDGQPCPTVRDFSVVDQDQSDNVTTAYLATDHGRIAQLTATNVGKLEGARVLHNGSDNGLINDFIEPALGCTPWMAPDLADPGHMTTALPLNELLAAAHQAAPIALVPALDPMVLVTKDDDAVAPNLTKLNLYRVGVDQTQAQTLGDANTKDYCVNLQQIAPPRFALDASLLGQEPTPDTAMANTLFTFLAQRYVTTFTGPLGANLSCTKMFDLQPRVQTLQNKQGVAIAATITVNGKTQCFNAQGQASPMNVCHPTKKSHNTDTHSKNGEEKKGKAHNKH